jgi:hypothetical protein
VTTTVKIDGINSPFQSLVRMNATILTGPDAPAIRKSNVQDNGRVNVNAVVRMPLDYSRYHFVDAADNTTAADLKPGTALAFRAADNSVTCFCASAGGGSTNHSNCDDNDDDTNNSYTSWAISVADTMDETGSLVQYFAQLPPSSGDGSSDTSSSESLALIKEYLLTTLQNLPHSESQCQFAIDLIAATPPEALFVRRSKQLTLVGPTFVSADSKIVLVGDCGHAMSPSYGQSFNFAFEDAVTLALAVRSTQCFETAVKTYSDLRVKRCEEMFRRSAERVVKQMKGEKTEDVLKWISSWVLPQL